MNTPGQPLVIYSRDVELGVFLYKAFPPPPDPLRDGEMERERGDGTMEGRDGGPSQGKVRDEDKTCRNVRKCLKPPSRQVTVITEVPKVFSQALHSPLSRDILHAWPPHACGFWARPQGDHADTHSPFLRALWRSP